MLIALLLLTQSVIHGFVQAEGSGEPVPFAVVELVGSDRQTQADAQGYYVLAGVEPGEYRLSAAGLGYQADTVAVQLVDGRTARVDFALTAEPVALPGIAASVRRTDGRTPVVEAGPAPVRMTAQSISRIPALAEPDVLRAVQTLPSFAAASDFSTALYVRGSSPDQTIVSLDGAPLFNPYHLGGVFAAIDPDAVAAVEARPGALPAGAPDRLAGAVDILTRDGGRDRVRSHGAIGLVSSRASLDGPLPGRRGSYLISARRTYLDVITGAAESFGVIPRSVPYGFTDAHLKLTHDVGKMGQLSASGYVNREGLSEAGARGTGPSWSWGTLAGSVGYRTPIASGATLYLTAAGSTFDATLYGWDGRPRPTSPYDTVAIGEIPVSRSDVGTGLLKADLALHRRSHTLRLGVHAQAYSADHLVDPRWTAMEQVLPDLAASSNFTTVAAYVEDEWTGFDRLQVRGGLRALKVEGRDPVLLPRIGLSYRLTDHTALTLGGGRYAQAVGTLRNEEALSASIFAYDLLTGVPAGAPLPTAEDVVLGAEWADGRSSLRVEGFGKRIHDLPLVPILLDPEDAPVLVADGRQSGSGRVVGLEVLGSYSGATYDLGLSYALTAARHTVDGLEYTPRYNRQHLLDLSASRRLGESGQLSFRLAAGSGQPTSTVIGSFQRYRYDPAIGRLVPLFDVARVYGAHNTNRLPPYLRLDVGVRKTYDREWFGHPAKVTPYFQVLNVLNSANPAWTEVDVFAGVLEKDGPRLPILPTLGVEWRF